MLRKACLALAALMTFLTAPGLVPPVSGGQKPRLTATFFQPLFGHEERAAGDWQGLFSALASLGIKECIVQWTLFDKRPFYDSKAFTEKPAAVLEGLLAAADASGVAITLGLVHDSNYWQKIDRDPKLVRVYLRRLLLDSMKLAGELAEIARKHESVTGWYIPQEIDDKTWLDPDAQKALIEYLADMTKGLRKAAPAFTVSVSGFTNAFADPVTCGAFFGTVAREGGLDRILFQDGVGVGKMELGYAGIYLDAVSKAVRETGAAFTPVVETFVQTGGEPIDDGEFKAEPAPLSRIEAQLGLAQKSQPSGIAAFSVPEYMTPFGGPKAAALFEAYKAYLSR